jgi:predicted phage-related endonuclease
VNAVAPLIAPDRHDRRRYVGGSDIGPLLGISPWKSPVDVYLAKTADEPPVGRERKIFRRGKRWESVVAEMLTEELTYRGHKVDIIGTNRRFQDSEHQMFASEIDFEIILDDEPDITNVELKTVTPFAANKWGQSESDDIPVWYTAQCMWGLGVAPGQRKRSILAALFGADELRTYFVGRDDEVIAGMRSHALTFWHEHLLKKVPPPPVNISDVQKLFPKDLRPVVIATDAIHEDYLRLRAIKAQIKACDAEFEAIEFRVMKFMRDAGQLLLPDSDKPVISWQPRAQTSFDFEGLKAAHPAIHRQFQIKGSCRPFVLK